MNDLRITSMTKILKFLKEFKKSLDSITHNEQRTFIFEHLRNNIHSEMQSFDIKKTQQLETL